MNLSLSRAALYVFTAGCLGLAALSAVSSLAAQAIIVNTDVHSDVYGNGAPPYGSGPPIADPNYNTVVVNSVTVGENVYGGYSESGSTVANNSVAIRGGMVTWGVFGGGCNGDATGNKVAINDSQMSYVFGGYSFSGDVTGNSVAVSSSMVNDVYGGMSANGNVAHNSVTINGGAVFGNVYGGFSFNGNTTYNTVTLYGTPDLGASTTIYGGNDAGDAFTGNSLDLHSTGLTVDALGSFEFLNFYLPATLGAGDAMLTVTGTAYLTEFINGAGRFSIVNVGIDGASSPLKLGDTVTLIQAGTLIAGSGLNATANGQDMRGVTLRYEFDITTANNQLLATVTKAGTSE